MSALDLTYVAAISRDVERVAVAMRDALELDSTEMVHPEGGHPVPVFSVGTSALAIVEPGHPLVGGEERTGIHHLGLAIPESETAQSAADARALDVDHFGAALGGGDAAVVKREQSAGVRLRLTTSLAGQRAPGTSGYVQRFDHIGVATDRYAETEAFFVGHLGYRVESRQTDVEVEMSIESFTSDKYGVIYHNRAPRQVGGGKVIFISMGDTEIEALEPFDLNRIERATMSDGRGDRPGDTRQDMGALTRFVHSRGAGLHHVAFKVADVNDALERFRARGFRTIDDHGRPGSRRAQIGFVHPSNLGGILIHFDAREEMD
jgi:catechol 2,3-dioxygenase-like lactoylglutathione lyase family enzyme